MPKCTHNLQVYCGILWQERLFRSATRHMFCSRQLHAGMRESPAILGPWRSRAGAIYPVLDLLRRSSCPFHEHCCLKYCWQIVALLVISDCSASDFKICLLGEHSMRLDVSILKSSFVSVMSSSAGRLRWAQPGSVLAQLQMQCACHAAKPSCHRVFC